MSGLGITAKELDTRIMLLRRVFWSVRGRGRVISVVVKSVMDREVLEVFLTISSVTTKWGLKETLMLAALLVASIRKEISRVEFGASHQILIISTSMLFTKMILLRAIKEPEDSSRSVPTEVKPF